jgi:hypothetical protein
MLLRSDVQLDADTERRVRADVLRTLADPTTDWDAPNGRLWIKRGLLVLAIVALWAGLKRLRVSRLQGGD